MSVNKLLENRITGAVAPINGNGAHKTADRMSWSDEAAPRVTELEELLASRHPQQRHEALLSLPTPGRVEEGCVDIVCRAAHRDPDINVRYAAVAWLQGVAPESRSSGAALAAVLNAASDPDEALRHLSVIWLGRVSDRSEQARSRAAAVLCERVASDPDSSVRCAALVSLERFAGHKELRERVIEAARTLADAADPRARHIARRLLDHLRGPRQDQGRNNQRQGD